MVTYINQAISNRLIELSTILNKTEFYAGIIISDNDIQKITIKSRQTGKIQWVDTDNPELTEKILKEKKER